MAAYTTVMVGEARIDLIADGDLPVATAELYRGVAEAAWAGRLPVAGAGRVLAPVHVALVRVDGETILIDAGQGALAEEGGHGGGLREALAELGVAPEAVTRVVITHTHGDHLLGLLDPTSGTPLPVFVNARHHLPRADWAWVEGFPVEQREGYLGPLRGLPQLTLDGDEDALTRSVRYVAAPGHTPGHRAVLVESGGAAFCFLGDLVHDPALQFADPMRVTAWDALPERTPDARRELAARARAGDWLLAATHAAFPPLGRLAEAVGPGWGWRAG